MKGYIKRSVRLLAGIALICSFTSSSQAQSSMDYSLQTGAPTFTTADPFPGGFVNLANGNMRFEVPLGNFPQRGMASFEFSLAYDSRIWSIVNNGTSKVWTAASKGLPGGWSLFSNSQLANLVSGGAIVPCNGGYDATIVNGPFLLTTPDNTQHVFPVQVQSGSCASQILQGDAFALDDSGYHLFANGITMSGTNVKVYDRQGTLVYSSDPVLNQAGVATIDSNGNQILAFRGQSPSQDTLGRQILSYAALPNSQKGQDPKSGQTLYSFSWLPISGTTNFYVPGVVEADWSFSVLQKIGLPDGTAYSFVYDCDSTSGNAACGSPSGQSGYSGELIGVTLPTGGAINFAYANFTDANGNKNLWVRSRTMGGGTWQYSPAIGCGSLCQTMTVTPPNGDQSVYSFQLNQGNVAWPSSMQHFSGAAGGTPVLSFTNSFQSYAAPSSVGGLGYTHPGAVTTTVPGPSGSLVTQTSFVFDTTTYTYAGVQYTGSSGRLKSKTEYGFGNGSPGPPLRSTNLSYWDETNTGYKTVNIMDRISDIFVLDGSGNQKADTKISYDSTSLTSVTGIVNHDDTNFGVSNTFRGNPTQIQTWAGGSTYLSTSIFYDTTGQVTQVNDPSGTPTRFGYADNFFTDVGDGPSSPPQRYTPSQPTNAYLTSVSPPLIPSSTLGYYYGTGQSALSADANGSTSYEHFFDALNRLTSIVLPNGGWTSQNYTSQGTFLDSATGITGSFNSAGCARCRHDQFIFDGFGRVISKTLASDPDGATSVIQTYDTSGRAQSVTHPHRASPSPTDGVESFIYDSLGHVVKTTHADGSVGQVFYGGTVATAGGLAAQNCPASTCGLGYPILSIDESGKYSQTWIDALGRAIEVDDPTAPSTSNSTATRASGTIAVDGSEQAPKTPLLPATANVVIAGVQRDSGSITITVNGFSVTVYYGPGDNAASVASRLALDLNSWNGSPVSALLAYGSTAIVLVSRILGSSGQYPLSTSSQGTSFTATPSSGNLTVPSSSPINDTGVVSISVNGFQASACYGPSSTASALATSLVNAFMTNNSSPVTASLSGTNITLVAKSGGVASNYVVSSNSATFRPDVFSQPSFSIAVSGSVLSGGANAGAPTFGTPSATTYLYDALDNLIQVTQGNEVRTAAYDPLSRVISTCVPEMGAAGTGCGTTLIYYTNSGGSLCAGDPSAVCRVTDPKGITTILTYDALSRLTTQSFSDGTPTLTYCYDGNNAPCVSGFTSANPNGRRTAMKDASGSTAWSYDVAGNPIIKQRTTNGVTQTFNYTYNLDGSLASMRYPSGRTVTYAYNGAQRPVSAVDATNAINYATNAHYAANGALASLLRGNGGSFQGITESYAFNNSLELTGITATSSAGTALSLSYGFAQTPGDNGSVASIVNNNDNTRSQSFSYDALNRLASAQSQASSGANCWGLSMGIDPLGNLTSENVTQCSAFPLSVSVNAKNQINTSGFAYDADGRITSDGTNSYTYDAQDNLISAAGVNYSYDGNGMRVMKSNGTAYWRGAGGGTLAETDLAGNLTSEYIFFGGARIASRDSSNNVNYYFTDHLGSTRVVTNATGAPCYQADFSPYGGELTPAGFTNTCPPKYRFTGYERDPETGMDYAIARNYNSHLGRFMSVDPLSGSPESSQSWNGYAYVQNNPVNLIDPMGEDGCDPTFTCTVSYFGGGSVGDAGGGTFGTFGTGPQTGGAGGVFAFPGGLIFSCLPWCAPTPHYTATQWSISLPSQTGPIGAPGFWTGLIPVYGSGRSAINDFQTGHWGWGIVQSGIAVTDVFLVKSALTAVGKVGVRGLIKVGGSETWSAGKSWMVRRGWRDFKFQQFHHWLIPQNGWGKLVPGSIKNQPWNILRIAQAGREGEIFHMAIEGRGPFPMSLPERLWNGSPSWTRMLLANLMGRGAAEYEPEW